jgi:integrase
MSDQAPKKLRDVCESLYFPRRITIRSENTRRQYFYAIDQFGEFLGRPATIADLDDDQLTIWLSSLMDRGLSIYTCREKVRRITALWNWCARRGLVPKFPTLVLPAAEDPTPRAWTREELSRLFDAASHENQPIAGIPGWDYWPARMGWYWFTGERYGATRDLCWEWIDLDRAVATVPAKVRKGRRKTAVYQLPPVLVEMLRKIVEPRRELVFPWAKCEAMYWKDFGRILKRAGLPDHRRKSHALRVSHATWLELSGEDASRSLLHGDSSTTQRHYIDKTFAPPQRPLFDPRQKPPEDSGDKDRPRPAA